MEKEKTPFGLLKPKELYYINGKQAIRIKLPGGYFDYILGQWENIWD
jgi:hypothetical protein